MAKSKQKKKKSKKQAEYSKQLISDIRKLLWAVTIGALLLAAYCIHEDFTGALPWLSAMVGLPWSAHGVVCSFYLNMAKSDHQKGGITYDSAQANGFVQVEPATEMPDFESAPEI